MRTVKQSRELGERLYTKLVEDCVCGEGEADIEAMAMVAAAVYRGLIDRMGEEAALRVLTQRAGMFILPTAEGGEL